MDFLNYTAKAENKWELTKLHLYDSAHRKQFRPELRKRQQDGFRWASKTPATTTWLGLIILGQGLVTSARYWCISGNWWKLIHKYHRTLQCYQQQNNNENDRNTNNSMMETFGCSILYTVYVSVLPLSNLHYRSQITRSSYPDRLEPSLIVVVIRSSILDLWRTWTSVSHPSHRYLL